jgi:hypothetical protein
MVGNASDGHGIVVGQQFQSIVHPCFAMLIAIAHEERTAHDFGDAVVITRGLKINEMIAGNGHGLAPRQSFLIRKSVGDET